jgi:hypothetical protein
VCSTLACIKLRVLGNKLVYSTLANIVVYTFEQEASVFDNHCIVYLRVIGNYVSPIMSNSNSPTLAMGLLGIKLVYLASARIIIYIFSVACLTSIAMYTFSNKLVC